MSTAQPSVTLTRQTSNFDETSTPTTATTARNNNSNNTARKNNTDITQTISEAIQFFLALLDGSVKQNITHSVPIYVDSTRRYVPLLAQWVLFNEARVVAFSNFHPRQEGEVGGVIVKQT